MSAVDEIGAAAKNVAAVVGPAVVRVGRGGGRGCGVVVEDGVVVTNAHNVRGDELTVTFADGRTAVGTVAGVDVDGDLAVVRVETDGTPSAPWRDRAVETGDVVFAVTRSAAGGTRVTFGLVSATERAFRGPRGRRITGSVEHTAPAARGSSGGPIVDANGNVVGINTNRLPGGFYLALPTDSDLRARITSLTAGESPTTPRLGVGLAPPAVARKLRASVGLPPRDGLLVRVVEENGPAAAAGIRVGDLVAAADGQSLSSIDDLFEALDAASGNGAVSLTIVRGVDELEVRVTFATNGAASDHGEA
jgi:serine protease Do